MNASFMLANSLLTRQRAHTFLLAWQYANNQWRLHEEIADSLDETSFRRAMALSRGTVTVLDQAGETYTRVWCCFEIYKSLLGAGEGAARKTYDV